MSDERETIGNENAIDELTPLVIGRGMGYRVECTECGIIGPIEHSPIAAVEAFLRMRAEFNSRDEHA